MINEEKTIRYLNEILKNKTKNSLLAISEWIFFYTILFSQQQQKKEKKRGKCKVGWHSFQSLLNSLVGNPNMGMGAIKGF